MNRYIRRVILSTSIVGAAALASAGVAFAHQPDTSQDVKHHGAHRHGLIGEALKLDSLTADQRSSVEQLIRQRRDAAAPVRAADSTVLTMLAQQVEQASIDTAALAPALGAEQSAAAGEGFVERDTLNRLHALLNPAQRGALVDRLEARGGSEGHARRGDHRPWGDGGLGDLSLTPEQRSQIMANLRAQNATPQTDRRDERRRALEAFRGDAFDPSALVRLENRGERAERAAQAMVPVLTATQRARLADNLRARAARETHGS